MAIDSSQLEGQIDSNLTDNITRENKASVVRFVLKTVVRWVRDAVNGNLSTWLRTADNQPGGGNADAVYRTGKVLLNTAVLTDAQLAIQQAAGSSGIRVKSILGQETHLPFSNGTHYLRGPIVMADDVTGDNVVVGSGSAAEKFTVQGNAFVRDMLRFNDTMASRKIALYGGASNDNQFYGFGVLPSTLRYQVGDTVGSHVFSAGTSPATSVELVRIQGNGRVGINHPAPGSALVVNEVTNPSSGVVMTVSNDRAISGRMGAKILFSQTGLSAWRVGAPGGDVDAFVIEGYGGGAYPEFMRIDAFGNVGINTAGATSRLHVKGITGHQQLRLETAYTPTGTNDPNGAVGQIAWDASFFYVKTATGWRRAAYGAIW